MRLLLRSPHLVEKEWKCTKFSLSNRYCSHNSKAWIFHDQCHNNTFNLHPPRMDHARRGNTAQAWNRHFESLRNKQRKYNVEPKAKLSPEIRCECGRDIKCNPKYKCLLCIRWIIEKNKMNISQREQIHRHWQLRRPHTIRRANACHPRKMHEHNSWTLTCTPCERLRQYEYNMHRQRYSSADNAGDCNHHSRTWSRHESDRWKLTEHKKQRDSEVLNANWRHRN